MRRGLVVAAVAAALSLPVAPAFGDSTVVVPGLAFPASGTSLSSFGCADLAGGGSSLPQVRIGKGDAGAALGTRSFALRMRGAGTAVGPVHRVESLAATTVAGFSARAASGSTGVSYVWFVSPGLLPGQVWMGRAGLAVGPGWQQVDTAGMTYTWSRYDVASGQAVEAAGADTIAGFTTVHGDGPGYLLAGLGCDGQEFWVDALRVGSPGAVTTYDLEGIQVSTTIEATKDLTAPGEEVTITGRTAGLNGLSVGSSLVLEARPEGSQAFQPLPGLVHSGPGGTATTTVAPEVTTDYRWYLPETGYADEGWSGEVRVVVRPDASR